MPHMRGLYLMERILLRPVLELLKILTHMQHVEIRLDCVVPRKLLR